MDQLQRVHPPAVWGRADYVRILSGEESVHSVQTGLRRPDWLERGRLLSPRIKPVCGSAVPRCQGHLGVGEEEEDPDGRNLQEEEREKLFLHSQTRNWLTPSCFHTLSQTGSYHRFVPCPQH